MSVHAITIESNLSYHLLDPHVCFLGSLIAEPLPKLRDRSKESGFGAKPVSYLVTPQKHRVATVNPRLDDNVKLVCIG